jgi:hypothetical protein
MHVDSKTAGARSAENNFLRSTHIEAVHKLMKKGAENLLATEIQLRWWGGVRRTILKHPAKEIIFHFAAHQGAYRCPVIDDWLLSIRCVA